VTLLLWWIAAFGVWPLADPGHDDLSSPLVWFDLTLHITAGAFLLNREINRRADRMASRRWLCGSTNADEDGRLDVCDRPDGHTGWHVGGMVAWNGDHR
jgi:hypothetical protein